MITESTSYSMAILFIAVIEELAGVIVKVTESSDVI